MQFHSTPIPGCFELELPNFKDQRGQFVKTFHEDIFKNHHLETHFTESYYSYSTQNVVRGLHFQLPPQDHTKLVHCAQGKVLDAVLDLRVGSPTYGQFATFELSAQKGNLIYIPPGLAHGFFTISELALVMYQVSTVYSPEHDSGLLWNSAGIPWPTANPIISEKDQGLAALAAFESPFVYQPTHS